MPQDDDVDYGCVDEALLLIEEECDSDEPAWLPTLRRSINGLHHSVAALHRKADHMSDVGDKLAAAVAQLEQKEEGLETAVSGLVSSAGEAVKAFTDLEAHVEQLVGEGVLTSEQAAALEQRANAVGTKLGAVTDSIGTASSSLSAGAAAGETAAGEPTGDGGGQAAELPLYNFTGSPDNIDATQWTKAALQGVGGVTLYTFNGDVAGGVASGPVVTGGGEGWTVWTGATEPIPAA